MLGAILGATGLSAVTGLLGASKASKSAKKAAQLQAQSAKDAMNQNQRYYDTARTDLAPYRQFGTEALTRLSDLNNTPFQFEQEPGYQYRLNEGEKGISRMTAAGSLPSGGATLKALNRFNQDYASNEYGNAYNRWADNRNNLINQVGIGYGAAGAGANHGMNYAGMNSDLITGAGNARAAGTVASGNAWNQGLTNLGNAGMETLTLRTLMNRPQSPMGGRVLSSPVNPNSYYGRVS